MELKPALKEQFQASLAMLSDCVEKCPDDLWLAGVYPRYYWRIALHAAFFTQFGLVQDVAAYKPWPDRPRGLHERMWQEPAYVEPYELPDGAEPLTREEVAFYISYLLDFIDGAIDALDLDSDFSGYQWYEDFSKLSNVLMTLRHIQGHVGQLSELLMLRGIDIDWVAKGLVSA